MSETIIYFENDFPKCPHCGGFLHWDEKREEWRCEHYYMLKTCNIDDPRLCHFRIDGYKVHEINKNRLLEKISKKIKEIDLSIEIVNIHLTGVVFTNKECLAKIKIKLEDEDILNLMEIEPE